MTNFFIDIPVSLYRFILIPILILFVFFIRYGYSQYYEHKRKQQTRKEIDFKLDTRPPILYLREFSKDGLGEKTVKMPWGFKSYLPVSSFEIELERTIKLLGPFYAIGNPGETEKEIGAVRGYHPDGEWQNAVLAKMKEAKLIIYRPSISWGTVWEFSQLIQNSFLPKTVICVKAEEKTEYEYFLKMIEKWKKKFPALVFNTNYIYFDDELIPLVESDLRNTKIFKHLSY